MSGRRALLPPLLLLAAVLPAAAEEPWGFRDRPWGTPWHADALSSLPGCAGQGELVADVEGIIARVAQPECVGYRFSNQLTVNLILFYPEIKWHRLDQATSMLRLLLSNPGIWALPSDVARQLEAWSLQLAWLAGVRSIHGDGSPVFRDLADVADLADSMRGLQGYQLTFPHRQYAAMKTALVRQLGPPAREDPESTEWDWDRTVAMLQRSGGAGASGYFVIVTRAYRDLVTEHERAVARRRANGEIIRPVLWRNPSSNRWFLETLESFSWAAPTP